MASNSIPRLGESWASHTKWRVRPLNLITGLMPADEIIAGRIIVLAKTGVVDPDQLCEQALNDLRLRADSMIVSTSAASRFKESGL